MTSTQFLMIMNKKNNDANIQFTGNGKGEMCSVNRKQKMGMGVDNLAFDIRH